MPDETPQLPIPKHDPATNTFSFDAVVYKKDKRGRVAKDADQKPVVEREIGHFAFRVPTIADYLEIGVRRAARLRGLTGQVDAETDHLASIFTTLPYLATSVPENWDWSALYAEDMEALLAVYELYVAGAASFRKGGRLADR